MDPLLQAGIDERDMNSYVESDVKPNHQRTTMRYTEKASFGPCLIQNRVPYNHHTVTGISRVPIGSQAALGQASRGPLLTCRKISKCTSRLSTEGVCLVTDM